MCINTNKLCINTIKILKLQCWELEIKVSNQGSRLLSDSGFQCNVLKKNIMNSLNVNTVGAGGAQAGNFVHSNVINPTFNIGQSDPPAIDISKILDQYKKWVLVEKENSQWSNKLEQLLINGKRCHIKRTLSMNGLEFPADDLLNEITRSETSLVTGPAGSGKSTLAASIIDAWAKSSESRFDLVLFLSSLHKMDKVPLHKQLWGEYAAHIREQDSTKIYEKLLEIKKKILFIIDGVGNTEGGKPVKVL